MNPPRSEATVMAASLAATWALAESGGAATTEDLAAAAGVSRRTFHRMFPRKEDCIRPAMADARRLVIGAFAQSTGLPLAPAYVQAFQVAAAGAFSERTRLLLPVVAADPHLQAVWDHEMYEGVSDLAEALVHRGDVSSIAEGEVWAAALLAVTNLALRDAAPFGDPVEHLRSRLEALLTGPGQRLSGQMREKVENIP